MSVMASVWELLAGSQSMLGVDQGQPNTEAAQDPLRDRNWHPVDRKERVLKTCVKAQSFYSVSTL